MCERRKLLMMKELLHTFFQYYLEDRNLNATLAMLSDQIVSIGTGEQEIARNKEELTDLLKKEFQEMPGSLHFQFTEYQETPVGSEGYCIFARIHVQFEESDDLIEMDTRFTGVAGLEKDGWKLLSLHMSTSNQVQEDQEFFPLRYGRQAIAKMSSESSARLMELVSKSLPGGIMGGYLEEGFPLYTINDRMLEILGYTYEELAAATDEKMMNIIYKEDQKRVEESIGQQFLNGNEYEVEYRIVGKGGKLTWVNDIGKKIVTEDGREAMISIMTDISDRRAREKQLIQEAYYDPLTGLYNRKKAISLYKEAFANGQKGTFFICDIDNFKSLNDTEGHIAGDHVLIFLARLISNRTKEFAISARLGGDEYMLFFPSPTETEEAVHLMKSIQTTFAAATKEAYPELSISLSVGGVVRKENEDFRSLYRQADTALYLAKHQKGSLQI